MALEELYTLVQRELAKDLVFEVDGEPVTVSIKGVLLARDGSKTYNFSFFELDETSFVLAIQMKGFTVYIGLEADEEIEEEALPELVEILLGAVTPAVALLTTRAEGNYTGKADVLLDDDMGPELKEFFYGLLIKHREGKPVYEQTEIA